jgi:hypothetical protein
MFMTANPLLPHPLVFAGLLAISIAFSGCSRNTEVATGSPPPAPATGTALPPDHPPLPAAKPVAETAKPVGKTITVNVRLSPALRGQAAPGNAVFIFARAAQGPRMPLAIVRKQVKDLPDTVTLDDSMAMMPDFKLSGFPEVVIGARVSKSGDAVAKPGDLEGLSPSVKVGGSAEVMIATVVGAAAKTESTAPAPHGGGTKTRLDIPADVKAKWKSAELSLTGQDIALRTVKVAIGGEVNLGKEQVLRVLAYVPAFQSDAGTVTSASSNPDNPAVLVQLLDRKQPVAEGWVFQKLPDFNTFSTDRLKVQLLGASG